MGRMQSGWRRRRTHAVLAVLAMAAPGGIAGQTALLPPQPAGELVRAAVANEVAAAKDTSVLHMFRSRKENPHGSQTKLYVETRDAMAGMLVASNDQPLTPQQQRGEADHLAWLMRSPPQLREKQAKEKEDAERTLRIVKALPNAFRYEYAGTEAGTAGAGKAGDTLVRLKFVPNPGYDPPSRVEQVLEGMHGYVLIDAGSKRIARIDGTLFKDVTFGWGFFGHLDKGGHFLVEQADVGDGAWEITRMSLSFTGKILLFKSINIVSDEVLSDFRRVPAGLTFAQGVELLKAEQQKRAHVEAPGMKKKAQ